ncbi:hypothetical protein [Criblamydia sequanensis]|uniref:Uncharacterized protein n=1 Tax=Candidatus Criblamydia sequanensis CRIB-18 TaxID=1437425 RepID=A0A090DYP2_9BACT|nr:hypothetical protein [Criblamydia sequanensis]CDR33824.1 hypothetical protein CSEC_0997 [Criblamydia sequanensis CRIB-18]
MTDKFNFFESKKECATESEEEASAFYWDGETCFFKDQVFLPDILLSPSASPYNTKVIPLKGDLQDEGSWDEALLLAKQEIEKKKYILWELDLGLFTGLKFPPDHQGQFATLQFVINHFAEKVFPLFEKHSLGVILYSGSLSLESELSKKKGLFDEAIAQYRENHGLNEPDEICFFEIAFRFLEELAKPLRDLVKTFIILDLKDTALITEARVLSKENSLKIQIIPKNAKIPREGLSVEGQKIVYKKDDKLTSLGLLMPKVNQKAKDYKLIDETLQSLLQKKTSFRLISEEHLITEWKGLDKLIVDPAMLSKEGFRMLQGFSAAGGSILTLREELGLPDESPFSIEDLT